MVAWTAFRVSVSGNSALAAILLAGHAVLLLISSRLQSPTRNEVAHIPAGLVCWEAGNYSLYSVNPPLWKMLATLPTWLLRPNLDGVRVPGSAGDRPEWAGAHAFAAGNAADYFKLIWSARLAGICWSIVGGWVIYLWADALYGGRAGLLALALWCVGPTVLAHAPLVTPDVPAAVAALAATYIFRLYLRTGTWPLAVATGGLIGVAQLTKFTLLVLYVVWPLVFLIHSLDRSNDVFRSIPLRIRLLQGAAIISLSLLVVNAGYEFKGTGTPLGDFQFISRTFTGVGHQSDATGCEVGNRFSGTWIGRLPVPIPADYLTGIDVQRRDFEGHVPSYLGGLWQDHGWWYYYLYALAVKVPLGTWALVLWGIVLLSFRRCRAGWPDELTVWLPAVAVLALVSSQTGFNHHSRYVLPALPFACVATGKVGSLVTADRRLAAAAAAVLLAAAVSSLRVYPHSLSYFNELAGGPDRGAEHLIDSNIDWGQDLFFFQAWAESHPDARPVGLAYANYIDYSVLGMKYGRVPADPKTGLNHAAGAERMGPHPGWFGVDLYSLSAGRHTYFQRFTPVAKAGYSIFIYHVTLAEANAARRQLGLPLLETEPP